MPKNTAKSLGVSKEEIIKGLDEKLKRQLPFLIKLSREELYQLETTVENLIISSLQQNMEDKTKVISI